MPEGCGCAAPPRRHCDICYANGGVFLACSSACLNQHQRSHGALTSAAERARTLLAEMNARHPDSAAKLAPHRQRLMELVANESGTLLVLGVGNASGHALRGAGEGAGKRADGRRVGLLRRWHAMQPGSAVNVSKAWRTLALGGTSGNTGTLGGGLGKSWHNS